ncbi:MAG: hypothetical protein WCO94_05750 [Verrucomicrobiota bacterium]
MKKLRTILATLCAHRAEADARQIRRSLRNTTRQLSAAAFSKDKRARGLRLFAAWSARRAPQTPAQPPRVIEGFIDNAGTIHCLPTAERKSA